MIPEKTCDFFVFQLQYIIVWAMPEVHVRGTLIRILYQGRRHVRELFRTMIELHVRGTMTELRVRGTIHGISKINDGFNDSC